MCVCIAILRSYLSSSSLDTPSLSLGDQSRGVWEVSLNEEEFDACFRVTRVIENDL